MCERHISGGMGCDSDALLAAILALLLLMGAGAAVLYGDSIQSWFRFQGEAITGHEMGEGQAAVLDHLSRKIGLTGIELTNTGIRLRYNHADNQFAFDPRFCNWS